MYGGKKITTGDTIFLFFSENKGGGGLVGVGKVVSIAAVPKKSDLKRQTPRVSIIVKRTGTSKQQLGQKELKFFNQWGDGKPETELNFKFYRQATNKIVGISDNAADYLKKYIV